MRAYGVVVPQAHVVVDIDATLHGFYYCRNQRFGVQVRRLDEDVLLGVADGGEPGFVLRDVYAVVVWC